MVCFFERVGRYVGRKFLKTHTSIVVLKSMCVCVCLISKNRDQRAVATLVQKREA